MRSKLNNFATMKIIVGTVTSIAVAVLLYIWPQTELTLALLVAIVGVIFSVAIDLLDRHEFANAFEAPLWFRGYANRMATAAKEVAQMNDPVLDSELRDRVDRCVADLHELSLGRFRGDAQEYEHLLRLTRLARSSIRGVTNVEGSGSGNLSWWHAETGRKYLRANQEAAGEGITVERVVIYREDGEALREFIESQCEASVEVWKVHRDHVPQHLRRNFVIWDERRSWEAQTNADGVAFESVYSANRSDARRLTDAFSELKNRAIRDAGGGQGVDP